MFFQNFKKNINSLVNHKYYCGLNFDDNQYQIIELKKVGDFYIPTYHRIFNSSNFINNNGDLDTENSLKYFKQIFKSVHTTTINISVIENKKLQTEIIDTLKIAGFKKINIIENNFDNILSLLINTKKVSSRYPEGEKIFNAIFFKYKIYFVISQNTLILAEKIINFENLNSNLIRSFLDKNKLDKQEVYISGDLSNLKQIKEIFYKVGVKTHLTNVWQNILNTEEKIPRIFLLDSHQYIKALGLSLSELPEIIEYVKQDKDIEKIVKEAHKKRGKFNLLALSSFKKTSQNKAGIKERKLFLPKKIKKTFLSKKISKIFLPKNKKKQN